MILANIGLQRFHEQARAAVKSNVNSLLFHFGGYDKSARQHFEHFIPFNLQLAGLSFETFWPYVYSIHLFSSELDAQKVIYLRHGFPTAVDPIHRFTRSKPRRPFRQALRKDYSVSDGSRRKASSSRSSLDQHCSRIWISRSNAHASRLPTSRRSNAELSVVPDRRLSATGSRDV